MRRGVQPGRRSAIRPCFRALHFLSPVFFSRRAARCLPDWSGPHSVSSG
jgi:hypothetical protein